VVSGLAARLGRREGTTPDDRLRDLAVKLAIVSDVHGNLAALEAVRQDLRTQGADEVLLGGDLVLGGRNPVEVLDLLAAWGAPAVLGNTDVFVLTVAQGVAPPSASDIAMGTWAAGRPAAPAAP